MPRGRDWLDDALRDPTAAMRTSLAALDDEHRDLLVALLDAPPSWVSERELAHALRSHHPGLLSRAPHELIDSLAGHFLRVAEGSIGWVHPSWRDLAIETLAADAERRARFLRVAGIDGIELAISVGGGAHGERNLPLAVDDGDWDVLATRSLELARELEPDGVTRLLRALMEATRLAPGTWPQREAAALARAVLAETSGRLGGAELPLPLLEAWLEAWLEAARILPDAPEPPKFSHAWAHLVPDPPFDRPEQIARAEEWLAFAEVLERYLPSDLAGLGFPDRYGDVLDALADAGREDLGDETLHLALERLARLAPSPKWIVRQTLLETPEEPPAPEPLPPGAVSVASVLRDLD